MLYDNIDAFSFTFPFPLSPKFHRVVLLLQACSTSEFTYDHACFCVHVYLLDLSSMYERKYALKHGKPEMHIKNINVDSLTH
jgi:hypothetical protein